MDWRDHSTFALGLLASVISEARVTLAVTAAILALLLLLWLVALRRTYHGPSQPLAATRQEVPAAAMPPTGIAVPPAMTLEGIALSNVRTILPKSPRTFLALVATIVAGCWALGFALAPDRAYFLTLPEWRFQPVYIAAHLITLRLIISIYTRNFTAGLNRIDIAPEAARSGLRLILGPFGRLAALAIAIPFCFLDYQFLTSARYVKLGRDEIVRAADLVMWGIWSAEWLINAFMWVVLVGYSIKNCWILRNFKFKAPVDVVLLERHYRPFLQMSSQGASVLLGFSVVTLFYITYTGGELSDYLGLAITGVLLLLGFIIPWALLKSKISRTVAAETQRLHHAVAQGSHRAHHVLPAVSAPDLASIEFRLNEALAILRIGNLERVHHSLGRTEAKAIMLRLLAPAATIGWQVSQNAGESMQKLERFLLWLASGLRGLIGG